MRKVVIIGLMLAASGGVAAYFGAFSSGEQTADGGSPSQGGQGARGGNRGGGGGGFGGGGFGPGGFGGGSGAGETAAWDESGNSAPALPPWSVRMPWTGGRRIVCGNHRTKGSP